MTELLERETRRIDAARQDASMHFGGTGGVDKVNANGSALADLGRKCGRARAHAHGCGRATERFHQ